jgi:hypothetical protein
MPTKNLLPSSKFAIIITAVAFLTFGGIALSSYYGSHGSFSKDGALTGKQTTLEDAITRDSNGNGVADWEESLWGLDPKGDGAKNKATINQKKAAAGITTTTAGDDTASSTPTEQFSKSLLGTILALKENGTLTQSAIENIGNSIGQDIDSRRSQTQAYTADDMSIVTTTADSRLSYYTRVKSLILKYAKSGIGTEFDPIANAISDESNTQIMAKLGPISSDYAHFAQDLIAIPAPTDTVPYTLNLANASAASGLALTKISTLYTDALTGMVGLDEYTVANAAFQASSTEMLAYFKVTHR